jgi:uncharacterized membrane protein
MSPFSTITIAIALMAVSVALLVLFIHTLARSIVSETVIERHRHINLMGWREAFAWGMVAG